MNISDKRILFKKTAMAEFDLLQAQYHLQDTVASYRTRWVALHDIIETFDLELRYVEWQMNMFRGKTLRRIMEDKNKSDIDWELWDDVYAWYLDARKKELQAAQEKMAQTDLQVDTEYYAGG